ncbi:hypothetical protein FHY55_03645 [Oceanicola sp. D3]|uniref:hypothetical protein n=1 Tax=Oceanicola sp. D3 TaxID=2587163 RepID=UPI00111EFC7E|nr:hypothetical protein [Oceanicola sp. D3]QDC08391.1 hypothetical protein FHY55_03645 [Oceanicola sp. D3]
MRVAALLLALTACTPAIAAEPVLELRVGPRAIHATTEDIREVLVLESHPPKIQLRTGPAFSRAVADFTAASIGEEAVLSICGEEVMRPRIMERISSPGMILAPIPPEKLDGFVQVLTGEASCPG